MNPLHRLIITPAKPRKRRPPPSEDTKAAIARSRAKAWTPAARLKHAQAVREATAARHARHRGPDGLGRLRMPAPLRHSDKPCHHESVSLPCRPHHFGQPILSPAQLQRLRDCNAARDTSEQLIAEPSACGTRLTLHGWHATRSAKGRVMVNLGKRWMLVEMADMWCHVTGPGHDLASVPVALVMGPVTPFASSRVGED